MLTLLLYLAAAIVVVGFVIGVAVVGLATVLSLLLAGVKLACCAVPVMLGIFLFRLLFL